MFNTFVAAARFRTPSLSAVLLGAGTLAAACGPKAPMAAGSAYTPAIVDTRNGARGGATAWGPPI